MKKLITLALTIIALLNCTDDKTTPIEISHNIKNSKITFAATSDTTETFVITSSAPWVIEFAYVTDIEWVTADQLSGESGTHTITLTADENKTNEERKTGINLISGDIRQKIELIQLQNNVLGLDVTKLNFKKEGGSLNVVLSQNLPYTISIPDDADWLTSKLTKAVVQDVIEFTAQENPTNSPRSTNVTITAGELSQSIEVSQTVNYLTFEPITDIIDFRGGSYHFTITSNKDWKVRSDSKWVSFDKTQGVGNGVVASVIATFENNIGDARSAFIIISYDDNEFKFEVKQQHLDPADVRIPHVYIDVENNVEITTKDYYKAVVRVDGGNKYMNLDEVQTKVKGRGNSTWAMPKKPYKLKLYKKTSILGLDPEKDWVLLANYIDPSLMVNSMAMKAGALLGVPFVNTMIPVDVTVNGEYRGSYTLTEQVEVKEARVNLSDDGYLLELDTNFDEDFKYTSPLLGLPVMVKGTELDLNLAFNNIKLEFNELEAMIMDDKFPNNGYEELIDIETVASFLLVNELTMNFEVTQHPKSVFVYKDKGSKFGMGPIWDFDWTCGYQQPSSTGHFDRYDMDILAINGKGAQFFNRFLLDPKFITIYKDKWNHFENNQKEEFFKYMTDYASLLSDSADKNLEIWSKPSGWTFAAEVERMEKWFNLRIQYLSTKINKL